MRKPIDDFAAPFVSWMRKQSLTPSTVYGYASNLRWFVKLMGTEKPSEGKLFETLKLVAEQYDYRYTTVRRVWTQYALFKNHIEKTGSLPEARFTLTKKSGKIDFEPILPAHIRNVVKLMIKDLDINPDRLARMRWKDVLPDPPFENDHTFEGPNVYLRDIKGIAHPCPVKWLNLLKAWGEPSEDTDPLIPLHPGSVTAFPHKRYLKA